MATQTAGAPPGARPRPARAKSIPKPSLPSLKVAKFKEVSRLLEQLVEENTDLFIEAGQRFRERHFAGTSRPLDPLEVAQVATCMTSTLKDAKEQIDSADIRAHDEPDPLHVLLATGASTSSVWIDALQRLVALIEMDDERFQAAREAQTLNAAIDADVERMDDINVDEMRDRSAAAMEHLAAQSGVGDPGKAWGVLGRSVWQALMQAAEQLRTIPSTSSLTSSPASTDGDEP